MSSIQWDKHPIPQRKSDGIVRNDLTEVILKVARENSKSCTSVSASSVLQGP